MLSKNFEKRAAKLAMMIEENGAKRQTKREEKNYSAKPEIVAKSTALAALSSIGKRMSPGFVSVDLLRAFSFTHPTIFVYDHVASKINKQQITNSLARTRASGCERARSSKSELFLRTQAIFSWLER